METEKKYIMTKETKEVNGKILHRIQAVKNFIYARAGDLGGFIEKEDNLSHEGYCWITYDAKVYDDARVYNNAVVNKHAIICGNAHISGNAIVSDYARVYDEVKISGYAEIRNQAVISGKAAVYENAKVWEHAIVCGKAKVHEDALVYGATKLTCGNWKETPLYIGSFPHPLNIDGKNKKGKWLLRIGCTLMSINEWLEYGKEMAKQENFDKKTTEKYRIFVNTFRDIYKDKN